MSCRQWKPEEDTIPGIYNYGDSIRFDFFHFFFFFRSMPAVEYSKSFITSVVVGKDVVPRIGLHQMEALRADLINAIKRSVDPKVRGSERSRN